MKRSASQRCLSRKREQVWLVTSIRWKGSHVDGDCCYFICLQRAETGPVGESCKEAVFRRLGLGLELLIKGCLGKKHFPFSWWCSGWGWVLSCHWCGAKILLWERAGRKSLALYQPCDFMSPDSLFSFYLNSSDNCGTDTLLEMTIYIYIRLQFALVLHWTIVRKVKL